MDTIIKFFIIIFLTYINLNAIELVNRTKVMMGTYISISLPKDKLFLSSLAFERLRQVELSLSSYDEEAEIYKLNHNKKIILSSDTYEALVLSQQYYEITRQYFDITIGSITKGLFHFGEIQRIPSKKERLDARVDFNGLHFTKHKAWIDKGIKIDLGGMGKGFGVDKAVELLKDNNVSTGVISLSGDIYCLHACDMAIEDPFSSKVLVRFTMSRSNTAISTSGNYRRYVQSKEYNHLINPKTRQSQKSFASISLLSTKHSNVDLDAYATAASVMPKDKALFFLNSMKDIAYLVIDTQKKMYINKLFNTLVKDLHFVNPLNLHKRVYIKAVPLTFQSSKKL
ncbi:MAG TPA: FAD:protein FMN transferase [Sulfurimonas sp.]|nr:FAD:protein FMN transferase [Sulfurimonas sp.]